MIEHFFEEPAEVYHAKAHDYLSSHQLIDFMRCPLLYHQKRLGLIEPPESSAYLIGRAAHTLILEGEDQYADTYATGGPINARTGKPYGRNTKAFQSWAEEQEKEILTEEQDALVQSLQEGVARNPQARELLSEGLAEGVIRTRYCGEASQIRVDFFHQERGLVDLKTCDQLDWFEADARRWRYANQVAFYQRVLAEATGEVVPVHIIAVEKREPYRCGVWRVSDDTLAIARSENEAAIRRLRSAREEDHWPTGYEEIRMLVI